MKDDIGERFKEYEAVFDHTLPRRLPMVIRIDGRGFHGLKLEKPFDATFFNLMRYVAEALCNDIQGAVMAYQQSDEISVIVRDDMKLESQPWFGKRLSKVLSVAASIATERFNQPDIWPGQFDARAFVLPDLNEVINYLVWRQKDAIRNSVQMVARSVFSHKQCHQKSTSDLKAMLAEEGAPWEDTVTHFKRGALTYKVTVQSTVPQTNEICERREWFCEMNTPTFIEDREYVETIYTRG